MSHPQTETLAPEDLLFSRPIASKIAVARLTEYDLWYWHCRRCWTTCHHFTHEQAIAVGLEHLADGCRPQLRTAR